MKASLSARGIPARLLQWTCLLHQINLYPSWGGGFYFSAWFMKSILFEYKKVKL